MGNTILITGSSAGIGKATVKLFAQHGWNVLATMRDTKKGDDLAENPNILVQQLDVTDPATIAQAVKNGIDKFGSIDVVVNNAGFGVFGAFEAADDDLIKKQFDTNVFGVMSVIKQVLPHFRKRREGIIINVSSGVGKVPLPMQTMYGASKFAIEGFSESLSYELSSLGIAVKIVLPGNIKTDFFNSLQVTDIKDYPDYHSYQKMVLENIEKLNMRTGASPEYVAGVIYKASTDGKKKLRYMAGKDISLFAKVRKILPDDLFMKIVKSRLE